MRRVWNGTGMVALLIAGVAMGAGAQDSDVQVEVQAELGVKKEANLSPEQQVTEAERISRTGTQLSERLTKLLDEARRDKDIIRVTCLDDKLMQVNANLRTVEQRLRAIREAQQMKDQGRLNHEFTVMSVLNQKFGLLDQEANQCVGQDLFEPGAAQVVTSNAGVSDFASGQNSATAPPAPPPAVSVTVPPPISPTL